MAYISSEELNILLQKEDLSENPKHCIYLAVDLIKKRLEENYKIKSQIERGSKIVTTEDNYYILGYDKNDWHKNNNGVIIYQTET